MLGTPIFDDENFVTRTLLPRQGGISLGDADHPFDAIYVSQSFSIGGSTGFSLDEDGNAAIGGAPNASAALTLTSTTQGFLLPRMTTTQRDAIASPAEGLVIYNTSTHKINVRVAAAWEAVTSA